MSEIWGKITGFIDSTQLLQQIKDVDAAGLFANPWFLLPFIPMVCYLVYKTAWRDLALIAIFIGIWWVSGTHYMDTLVVGNELQIDKILPVVFGGAIALGVIIYLLLNKS